jgi:hypothetical protein
MEVADPVRESNGVANSRCALHPERQGIAVCNRCGDYHCAQCHEPIAGRALCARCRELPGVDHLEDTRRRCWGKRDFIIWCFGLLPPLSILTSLPSTFEIADSGYWVGSAAWLIFSAAYLAKVRLARTLSIPFALLDAGVDVLRVSVGLVAIPVPIPISESASLWRVILGCLWWPLMTISAYRSPRNRLAFQLEVDERDLQRIDESWPTATREAVFSALALFIPFASAFTLAMSLKAYRRSSRLPRRGSRVLEMFAIGLSVLGLLAWLALLGVMVATELR